MKSGYVALGFVLILFALAAALLSGCAGMTSPQFCVRTDYGTFCYAMPELPALKDK